MIPPTREVESAPAAVRIGGRLFPFTTYADVSRAYTAAVDASGAVAGTTAWVWRLKDVPIAPDCEILDSRGHSIAWVSYNGRIWRGPLHNNDYKLIYDPRGDSYSDVTFWNSTRPGAISSGRIFDRQSSHFILPKKAFSPAATP